MPTPLRGGGQLVQHLYLRAAQHAENRGYQKTSNTACGTRGFRGELKCELLKGRAGQQPVYHGSWNALVIWLCDQAGDWAARCKWPTSRPCTGLLLHPHIVDIEGRNSIDRRFYEKQYTMIDPSTSNRSSRKSSCCDRGSSSRALGGAVCGQAGTAQNRRTTTHSTFLSLAVQHRDLRLRRKRRIQHHDRLSLQSRDYLTDTITHQWLVDRVKNMQIYYPSYAK